MGRYDDAISGIRALLGEVRAPRVTPQITDRDAIRFFENIGRPAGTYYVDPSGNASAVRPGQFGDDARRAYERLFANGTDEQTAAIIARGVETGVPQTLPGGGLVRPPVFDPDTGRYLDTLRMRGVEAPRASEPDFALDSPLFRDAYRADQAYDNLKKGRTGNLRNSGGDLARIAGQNIREADSAAQAARQASPKRDAAYMTGGALALAAAGAGVSQMASPGTAPKSKKPEDPVLVSGGAADLVEESRPAPKVPDEPAVDPADYSLQARELINNLNAMRRKAGGEVPEAAAMMKEINRLVELGNKQRQDPGYSYPKADPAQDPYQQARDLIAQVNQMYQRGASQNSPEVQRIMAKVRQLQAQGDAIRNRRVG